ncbi:site-specific integrase [Halostella sp. PRR32]|uniref:tyrosine-type recombinase/integrase n=1 Tax=Halostella sp. PRR32 TaxID=3098147 RepID=UPI002B1D6A09|nr:site-specific integrase [Halostella sp. PRR32]
MQPVIQGADSGGESGDPQDADDFLPGFGLTTYVLIASALLAAFVICRVSRSRSDDVVDVESVDEQDDETSDAVEQGLSEKVHAPELPDGAESRDVHLDPERAEAALEYYGRHRYASRDHALLTLIWRTGMRRGAVQSLDRGDLEPDAHAVRLEHRIDEGTKLKNGEAGERWVYLGPKWFQILDDYLDNPDRVQGTDEYGRKPLFTTQDGGRPSPQTIYKWLIRALHPCSYASFPHDRTPETCDARGRSANVADCPSSRSPHAVRRGAITHHLTEDTPPETVSERMDVSLDVLYQHYDARTEREKMDVRTDHLPE